MKNLFNQVEELVENTNNSPVGFEYDLRFDIADFITDKLNKLGKKKKWLAEKLNMKQSQLSRILRTNENLTLQTISRIFWALREKPEISYKYSFEKWIDSANPIALEGFGVDSNSSKFKSDSASTDIETTQILTSKYED